MVKEETLESRCVRWSELCEDCDSLQLCPSVTDQGRGLVSALPHEELP